jgi:ferritin-like metal-binding protein YciE
MPKAQASRLEHYADLRARIEQHLEERLGQQQILEQCLTRYDASLCAIKDRIARMAASGQRIGGMVTTDEVVKDGLAGYVFEHPERAE